MARVEGEIIIHRPVEEMFDFVADERNEPRYGQEDHLGQPQTAAGVRGRASLRSG